MFATELTSCANKAQHRMHVSASAAKRAENLQLSQAQAAAAQARATKAWKSADVKIAGAWM